MLDRWNPWLDLFDAQREMSEFLKGFGAWNASQRGRSLAWAPAVDVFSRDGDLVVRAELPGIDPEKDVDISVQDNVLSIHGERRQEQRTNGDNYYRVESAQGSFHRQVPLPEGVKAEDIQASYRDGILEVVIPQAAALTSPKRVPITVADRKRALTAKARKK